MIIIPGNHDIYYRNTNKISAVSILDTSDNIRIIEQPEIVDKFIFIPWINKENYDETITFLSNIINKEEYTVQGHFEINGMAMYKGSFCTSGLDKNIFKGFKKVYSGHFHEPSTSGNIEYLGSTSYITWQDYDCDRGFHILNKNSGDSTFVNNNYNPFIRITYNQDNFNVYKSDKPKILDLVVDDKGDESLYAKHINDINSIDLEKFTITDNTIFKEDKDSAIIVEASETITDIISDQLGDICENEKDFVDMKELMNNLLIEAERC
jgi:hypothetical protein